MEKNALPPSNQNKTIVLSLATCALLGIIGFEAFMEKSDRKLTPPPVQNFYPYPLELQNEQLKIELNHSRAELNELKRQLFVRSKAPDYSLIRNLKNEITLNHETIENLRQQLEIQEKESILTRNELYEQFAKERAFDKLDASKLEASLFSINEAKETLQTDLEKLQVKLEVEKEKSEQQNLAIASEFEDWIAFEKPIQVINKEHFKQNYMLDLSALEHNVTALTASLTELQKEYKDLQNVIDNVEKIKFEKSNVEDALVFEQLTNKLAFEKLQVELNDFAYALLSLEQQNLNLKQNLEEYLATHEHLKNLLESQNVTYQDKVGKLESEITFLKHHLETYKKDLLNANEVISTLETLPAQISSLEFLLHEKEADFEHLNVAFKKIESENLRLKEKEKHLSAEFARLESMHLENSEQLAKEKDQFEKELAQLLSVKSHDEEYVHSLEKSLLNAEESLQKAVSALTALEERIAYASMLEYENQRLETAINELHQESEHLTTRIADLETSLSQNDKNQNEINELLKTKLAQEAHMQHLEDSLETAENSLNLVSAALFELQEKMASQFGSLELKYKNELAISEEWIVHVSELENENQRLETALNASCQESAHLNATIAHLETSFEQNDKKQNEINELLQTKIVQEADLHQLKESLKTAENSLELAASAFVELQEKMESQLASLEENYKNEFAKDLHGLQNKYQEALISISELQTQLELKEKQTLEFAYQLTDAQKQYLESELKFDELKIKKEFEPLVMALEKQVQPNHEETIISDTVKEPMDRYKQLLEPLFWKASKPQKRL